MPEGLVQVKYGEHYFLREKQNGLTCGECGNVFEKPVLATVSSGDSSKTYYACPRCLTKVKDLTSLKNEEDGSAFVVVQKAKGSETSDVKCAHFFGFLKKRPKNMPIPDECLTCSLMIKCLTQ